MAWLRTLSLTIMGLGTSLSAGPLMAQEPQRGVMPGPMLTDAELAQLTGKFFLPGGVEVALTVTSDTVLNGQTLLRTVLAVDHGSTLTVYGRNGQAAASTGPAVRTSQGAASFMAPTGVAVLFDRHSGTGTITPTYAGAQQPSVTLGAAVPDAAAQGLERLTVTPDGPAVQTPDGLVSVRSLANGSLVSLSGDQLAATHLVGQSIATALANSGNDRTFDNVTNIAVDLRNVSPYQIGAAAFRADTLALEATRGLIR